MGLADGPPLGMQRGGHALWDHQGFEVGAGMELLAELSPRTCQARGSIPSTANPHQGFYIDGRMKLNGPAVWLAGVA